MTEKYLKYEEMKDAAGNIIYITEDGHRCYPWIDSALPWSFEEMKEAFENNSAKNKQGPKGDPESWLNEETIAKWSRCLDNVKFWCPSSLCMGKNPGDGTLTNPGGTANHACFSASCWLCAKMRPSTYEIQEDGTKVFTLTFEDVPEGPRRDHVQEYAYPPLFRSGATWEQKMPDGTIGWTGPVPSKKGKGGKRGSTPGQNRDKAKSRKRSSSNRPNRPPLRVSLPSAATLGIGLDAAKIREDHFASVRNSILEQDSLYLIPPMSHANDATKAKWKEHRSKVAYKTSLDFRIQMEPDNVEIAGALKETISEILALAEEIRQMDPAHMMPKLQKHADNATKHMEEMKKTVLKAKEALKDLKVKYHVDKKGLDTHLQSATEKRDDATALSAEADTAVENAKANLRKMKLAQEEEAEAKRVSAAASKAVSAVKGHERSNLAMPLGNCQQKLPRLPLW
jgi:hypothetical protein